MFFIKKLWCRVFQLGFRLALPILPYRKPEILSSCEDLCTMLAHKTAHRVPAQSVLIVTDRGIVQNGLCKPLCDALSANGIGYTVYDGTQPNPTVDNVEDAYALWCEHHCDTLIAVGGGSAMDCAKAVGVRASYPGRKIGQSAGILRVWRSLPTLIAIPTTAGTGSETTLAAVITDPAHRHKYAIMSFPLIPHVAVLDPTLTKTLPPHLTATTGMDALTHAVEAYIGRSTTKETRALAVSAVKRIFANIERAYRDGSDLCAREEMLHAAYEAGAAFSKSYVGYVHALAHALGGRYGTPHGLANAVILPYVLEGYGASAHKKLHKLGIAAGICTEQDTPADGARSFIAAICLLNERMGIPKTIDGIRRDDIPILSAQAAHEANPLYPVPRLMDAAELTPFLNMITGERHENL